MKTALVPLFTAALLGAAGSALAEPAIYQNGTLTIPNGAIFTDSRQDYYTHIVLGADADGKLDLLSAIKMPLTYVDSVEPVVELTENGMAVTLYIAGSKSVPCVDLLEPAVNLKGIRSPCCWRKRSRPPVASPHWNRSNWKSRWMSAVWTLVPPTR